ncbi:MAG: hypothetical protein JHC61_00525 [Burkholderiaceae bacterium]|nr:hypothetical protein [Burkholderiaceae bacterium]
MPANQVGHRWRAAFVRHMGQSNVAACVNIAQKRSDLLDVMLDFPLKDRRLSALGTTV